jgi:formamidopyrimidine-DNA glycosylase
MPRAVVLPSPFPEMPELPEVETIARGLHRLLRGRRMAHVRLGKTDFIESPGRLLSALPGASIAGVRRYGKYLLLDLVPRGSSARDCLLIHLGMTGRLTLDLATDSVPAHTHVRIALDDGDELRLNDIRRFGRVRLLGGEALGSFLARLGDDPLEIREREFLELVRRRRGRIKALLLDQRRIRGLGNIYADEILWVARIHPARTAASLSRAQAGGLWRAMRRVLAQAIRFRGSSVANYVDALGRPGGYQRRHNVYRREGKRCPRCRSAIRRVQVAGRSSCFCPACQPGEGSEGRDASGVRDGLPGGRLRRPAKAERKSVRPTRRARRARARRPARRAA